MPTECTTTIAASEEVRVGAARHPWQVLAVLCALMGFASISTDLYLPAMPVIAKSLGASLEMVSSPSLAA